MGPAKGLNNKVEVVSPFLKKTYCIVDDPSTDEIVSWTRNGQSFTVWKEAEFCQLLQHHFNHTKISSFVRQLNTYGFRKLHPVSLEYGNNKFLKGHSCLLKGIRRGKPSKSKSYAKARRLWEEEEEKAKEPTLVAELERTRKHQEEMESTIQSLQNRISVMEQTQQKLLQFILATKSNFASYPTNLDVELLDANNSLPIAPEKEGDQELEYIGNSLYSSIIGSGQLEIWHTIAEDSSSFKETLVHEDRDDESRTIFTCSGYNNDFWDGLLKENVATSY